MDNSWSNAGHEQRVGRTHRTGQTKPVFIYSLEARGTVDEKIRKLLATKKGIADDFAGINKQEIKSLIEEPF
jgi:SNF2 family DNA or RNA helicase